MTERYLTARDIAGGGLLPQSESTLRWWRHIGRGPKSFKIGKKVVYAETDVIRWIEQQRAATEAGDAA